jgi:putative transposase
MQDNAHFSTAVRYVERNPLRANMVDAAQDLQWSSLACPKSVSEKLLAPWPIDRPRSRTALVNEPPAGIICRV